MKRTSLIFWSQQTCLLWFLCGSGLDVPRKGPLNRLWDHQLGNWPFAEHLSYMAATRTSTSCSLQLGPEQRNSLTFRHYCHKLHRSGVSLMAFSRWGLCSLCSQPPLGICWRANSSKLCAGQAFDFLSDQVKAPLDCTEQDLITWSQFCGLRYKS